MVHPTCKNAQETDGSCELLIKWSNARWQGPLVPGSLCHPRMQEVYRINPARLHRLNPCRRRSVGGVDGCARYFYPDVTILPNCPSPCGLPAGDRARIHPGVHWESERAPELQHLLRPQGCSSIAVQPYRKFTGNTEDAEEGLI